jgi:hypothetical protein
MKQITGAMLLLLQMTGCGSSISLFDQYAYTQATSIKVDASDVMNLATGGRPGGSQYFKIKKGCFHGLWSSDSWVTFVSEIKFHHVATNFRFAKWP